MTTIGMVGGMAGVDDARRRLTRVNRRVQQGRAGEQATEQEAEQGEDDEDRLPPTPSNTHGAHSG